MRSCPSRDFVLLSLSSFVSFAASLPAPQAPSSSSATSPTPVAGGSPVSASVSSNESTLKRLIPLIVVLSVLVVFVVPAIMFRRRLATYFQKHLLFTSDAAPETTTNPANTAGPVQTIAVPVARPVAGVSNSDRPAANRRSRRRRRRSGDSVVGLPLYSEDPNEEEMTLFKHRPSMDSRMSIDMIQYDNEASDSEGEAASLTRPSMDSSTYLPSTTGRSRSASDAPSTSTSEYRSPLAYPDRVATAIDIVPGVEALASSSSTFLSPTGTPSSPGHPMSQSTSNIAGLSPPARPAVGRSRASTLRSIFSSSPLSGESGADVGRSPYGQGFSGSRSTTRLAGSSTLSVASLNIGSPLTHTLVSSSFIFPKNGLTPQQVAFISSRESLGAFGYGPGAEPPAFEGGLDLSRTSSSNLRSRSASVSTQLSTSSPLRNVSSPTPSAPSDPPPAFTPGLSPASIPLPPSTPGSTTLPDSPTLATPSSPSSPPMRSTGGPPVLPQLQVLRATPSNSTQASPVVGTDDDAYFESLFSQHGNRRDVSTISEASFVSAASFATARQGQEDP